MAKDYDDEKNELPGMVDTVYLPAFIKSGSTFSS
jgi:hypothetical protein